MSATLPSESAPLLPDVERAKPEPTRRIRAVIHAALSAIFVLTLVLVLFFLDDGKSGSWLSGQLPKDPILAAQEVLKVAPVIVRLFTFHCCTVLCRCMHPNVAACYRMSFYP